MTSFGPLVKAVETVKVFAGSAPSPAELWANRSPEFERIHAIVPSTVEPGESVAVTLQAWDQCERLWGSYDRTVSLVASDPDATVPDSVSFADATDGVVRAEGLTFETPGVQYLTITDPATGETFHSNPVRVVSDPDRCIYWGDIHLHSVLSDGADSPERGYRFGRDVMDLDVVAYTDHDTMGFFIPPSLQRRRMHDRYFDRLCATADAFDEPGEFVTLPAYEWTKQPNVGGHINVYFDDSDDATLFDSISRETNSYEKLWERLREWDDTHDSQVVTIPHHPAESMYPFDFSAVEYDDELAPLVEVYSQWGSSERPGDAGNRFPLKMGQGEIDEDGHYVQDAIELGNRVRMIGGADYHGPAPGHSLIHTRPHFPSLGDWKRGGLGWGTIWRVWNERSYPGGLTAFHAPELTREAIVGALRSRAVYATTQPDRILVEFTVNGTGLADTAAAVGDDGEPRELAVSVAGTAPIAAVTVVKNGHDWRTIDGTDDPDAGLDAYTLSADLQDDEPITAGDSATSDRARPTEADGGSDPGASTGGRTDAGSRTDTTSRADAGDTDSYYVRVRQADEPFPGTAWVGPIWAEPE